VYQARISIVIASWSTIELRRILLEKERFVCAS